MYPGVNSLTYGGAGHVSKEGVAIRTVSRLYLWSSGVTVQMTSCKAATYGQFCFQRSPDRQQQPSR